MDKLKKILEELSKKNCALDDEDFNVMDWSGGNFDDAWQLGFNDGQISLARELLKMMKEEPDNDNN